MNTSKSTGVGSLIEFSSNKIFRSCLEVKFSVTESGVIQWLLVEPPTTWSRSDWKIPTDNAMTAEVQWKRIGDSSSPCWTHVIVIDCEVISDWWTFCMRLGYEGCYCLWPNKHLKRQNRIQWQNCLCKHVFREIPHWSAFPRSKDFAPLAWRVVQNLKKKLYTEEFHFSLLESSRAEKCSLPANFPPIVSHMCTWYNHYKTPHKKWRGFSFRVWL